MAIFEKNDGKYIVVIRCPWCGQRTTKLTGKMKDAATDCEKCGTRYYQSSTICYVLADKVDMADKNLDEPLIR